MSIFMKTQNSKIKLGEGKFPMERKGKDIHRLNGPHAEGSGDARALPGACPENSSLQASSLPEDEGILGFNRHDISCDYLVMT